MATTAIVNPSSLEQMYHQQRDGGADHDEAARVCTHSFGGGRRRRDLDWRLDRVRAAWERDQPPERVEDKPPVEPVADPLDAAEQDARSRIEALQRERQALALDSLTDDDARSALASVESELAETAAELERIALARIEAQRREAASRDHEQQEAIAAAMREAASLQGDREKAAARVDRTATAFAEALAAHHDLAARQARALGATGFPRREIEPAPWMLEGALMRALSDVPNMPRNWAHRAGGMFAPDQHLAVRRMRAAKPLAETDCRPVEPKV
jgi:hypothetical protein